MRTRKSQSALNALDSLARCVDVAAQSALKNKGDVENATFDAIAAIDAENVSDEERAKITRVVKTFIRSVKDARKEAKSDARLEIIKSLEPIKRYSSRALAFFLCVGFGIAFFYTPRPLGSCVPLAFAVYILGVTFPLKWLLKFKRDARSARNEKT